MTSVSPAFWQIVVVAFAVAIVAWLWSNAVHKSVRRISTGFAFLGREAATRIPDSPMPTVPKDTYLRAFIVGIVNTLRVAFIGVALATVLGTMIGIARLSSNWLLSRLAAVYVEAIRDLPSLLQLLFWYVLMQGLPAARAASKSIPRRFSLQSGPGTAVNSHREADLRVSLSVVVGLIALYALRQRLVAQGGLDGKSRLLWPPVVVGDCPRCCRGRSAADWGTMRNFAVFNFVGGLTVSPEYFALLIALVTYTSAFIAEIVRSGIQAVKGDNGTQQRRSACAELSCPHMVLPRPFASSFTQ